METFLIKDILKVQFRATKFILGDYSMDYKLRLTNLKLLPLMYIYELTDILFAIKSFKNHTIRFDVSQHSQFNESTTIDLLTLSFITRYTTMPSLLTLIL